MKPEAERYLKEACSNLGKCAKVLSAKSHLTPAEKEILIGLGTARDWVRWAVALNDITYRTRADNKSARKAGIIESVRFNQIWTAANALFAKESILKLMAPKTKIFGGEGKRFKVIYRFAKVDRSTQKKCVKTLRTLLDMECMAEGITALYKPENQDLKKKYKSKQNQKYPTMWEVIDQKYSRPEDRTRGIGKVISGALAANRLPRPTGPTIIYGARNWTVHGMLLTSFFRGSKEKYKIFMDNIILLLAAALEGSSRQLHAKI